VYDAVVAAHVLAAIVGFGATFTYPVIQFVAERHDRRSLPLALTTILTISRFVAVPATTLVGLTGIYQVASGPYRLSDAWVAVGLGLYLVVMALGIAYLAPAYRTAEREARAMVDGPSSGRTVELSPGYRAAMRGPRIVGPAVAAAILTAAVIMEIKPG
jgi:uncharacterized membrane protein